ncbi:hypothetical protein N9Y42_11150, partial [Mariniblastus sp.]|nr:hypothetical protein [Mariniblastus sp.]
EPEPPLRESRMNIGRAIVLFLVSVPALLIGTIWTFGGSRPHLAKIVVPAGIATLALALTLIVCAVRICLKSNSSRKAKDTD